ncbi:uncharacterized protein LOC142982852 [Anticarsia gemmatalis]|uniref:uncharacterized protein LOC142982852 n=1 Tax=Anticarsia gemmatalis TaxID=129554 RepID=UPI003F7690B7
MLMAVTILTLLTRIPYGLAIVRACVPNTQFLLNGRLCYCNNLGQSNDATCQYIGRRQACQPGQVIWEECSQCICQENGRTICTNTDCNDESAKNHKSTRVGTSMWCTPFRSYYLNCTLCVCPASGKMAEARCAADSSCALKGFHTSLDTMPRTICIPKVMYLFKCLHCLCSDNGQFLKSKCVETCTKTSEPTKRCIPKSFYKSDCNICRCPDNGVPDSNLCSKSTCIQPSKPNTLFYLRNKTSSCTPNKFTNPRCIYCECNSHGVVNETVCIEQECLKVQNFTYDTVNAMCSPGELVPICMECFCPRTGLTIEKYCSRVCSPQNKVAILETVLNEQLNLIDRDVIRVTTGTDSCEPHSLILDEGRYCLCSASGDTNNKHCTSVLKDNALKNPSKVYEGKVQNRVDFNFSCEPNTYVKFGCNSCYCGKSGKIDPKWCTSDDCAAKRQISETLKKVSSNAVKKIAKDTSTCVPGSISKANCNFCICSSTGLLKDRVCTRNVCTNKGKISEDELSCEPASYYTVDCNICFCPSDGIRNIDKCTKNQCENNFLRTDICAPGELFSDDCNICVCPPNGEKKDKICTNRNCTDDDTPWKKIFKISEKLLGGLTDTPPKKFGACYPGEMFDIGCSRCTCPDSGLKEFAICDPQTCDDTTPLPSIREERHKNAQELKDMQYEDSLEQDARRSKMGSYSEENCQTFNLTDDVDNMECTPGSEYIVKCKICICPYMGHVNHFCRPMPKNRYCEQAFPGFNFLPGRRTSKVNSTAKANDTQLLEKYPIVLQTPHKHTKYECNKFGVMMDECFLCECVDLVLTEEHCYKSDAENCTDVAVPTFLKLENRLYP